MFSVPFRVRYSEADRQGIAYQGHYVTWFDLAIWEFMRALPWDMAAHQQATDGDFHTVRNVVDYAAPLAFDQQFSVSVAVQHLGRSSVTFALAVHSDQRPTPHASGEVVWVHANQTTHQSMPLPPALATRLQALITV
jgi:acyl-CoA thioester hydrolase